jgi:ferric-dicitrate binding protein FerR (iron transport regulator)
MLQQSDIETLTRFSQGTASPEEEKVVQTLFADHEESCWLEDHLRSGWNEYLKTNPGVDHDLSRLLDRVHHMIHTMENRKRQSLVRKVYRWYSVAAAILLVPLLTAGILWIATRDSARGIPVEERVTTTIHAPKGSRVAFTLPDNTKGWLNSGSSLEYALPFSNNRQVTLAGEAWFEVAKDEANPFKVIAGKSEIKVLGTKFNVSAYPEENYVEVALGEGNVEFSVPGLSSPVLIKPDERLICRNGKINLCTSEASKYAAWVEGKLVFRGDPMAEVARRLERWYNVKVEVVDKELENYVFRGTFQDDSFREVLRLLSLTSPIRYRIIERKLLDDGTFDKERVLLHRKKIANQL